MYIESALGKTLFRFVHDTKVLVKQHQLQTICTFSNCILQMSWNIHRALITRKVTQLNNSQGIFNPMMPFLIHYEGKMFIFPVLVIFLL